MAWNGSDIIGETTSVNNKMPAKKQLPLRSLICCILVVLAVVFIVTCIMKSAAEKDGVVCTIQKAEAVPVTTNIARIVKEVKEETGSTKTEKIEMNKLYRDSAGRVIFHPELPAGSPANPIRLAPVNRLGNIRPPKKLYDTFAENYIVGILRTKPGMPVVRTALPKNFDEQFKARIADPIGIQDDDTEDDIALRKVMVEIKREMAQLIADGKNPSQIILEEREKLNRLAETRKTMLREISNLRKSGAEQSEVDLMVEAANRILKDKGIAEIKIPAFLRQAAMNADAGGKKK